MVGTLIGVPLVGWFAPHVGTARTTALAALSIGIGIGVAGFALIEHVGPFNVIPGFVVGLVLGVVLTRHAHIAGRAHERCRSRLLVPSLQHLPDGCTRVRSA